MKKARLSLKIALFFGISLIFGRYQNLNGQSISYNWAATGGNTGNEASECVVQDQSGNTYATGYFSGTVDFDHSSSTYNLTSAGDRDIFIAKYTSSGALVWVKGIGNSYVDYGSGITIDPSGNVLVAGAFSSTVDFNTGSGVDTLTSQTHYTVIKKKPLSPKTDVFILKLDADGGFLWVRRVGSSGYDNGRSIASDATGNVWITGSWMDLDDNGIDTGDFDPGAGFFYLTDGGCFLLKLSAAGNFIFAANFGQMTGISSVGGGGDVMYTNKTYSVTSTEVVINLADNSVYFSSSNYLWMDVDPGVDTINPDPSTAGYSRAVIVCLDSLGNYKKHVAIGSKNAYTFGNGLALDQNGNTFLTGHFLGTVDFDPGSSTVSLTSSAFKGNSPKYDAFIIKLNSTFGYTWVKQFGASTEDIGYDVTVNDDGDPYVTGNFSGKVDFNPASGRSNVYYLTSKGGVDQFLTKLNASGGFKYATQMGSTADDWGKSVSVLSGESNTVATCGGYSGTADMNPTSGSDSRNCAGGSDYFVQYISESGSSPSQDGDDENSGELETVNIFPNPSTGVFMLSIPDEENIQIEVYTSHGQKVETVVNRDAGFYKLNLLSSRNGMYLLKLTSAIGTTTYSLVKMH